jgi:hypothetical protein
MADAEPKETETFIGEVWADKKATLRVDKKATHTEGKQEGHSEVQQEGQGSTRRPC